MEFIKKSEAVSNIILMKKVMEALKYISPSERIYILKACINLCDNESRITL